MYFCVTNTKQKCTYLYLCKYYFIYCVITFCVSKIYLIRCTFYQKIFGFVFKGKPSAVKIYGKNDSFWEMFDLAKSRTFVCEQGLSVWDCIVFFFFFEIGHLTFEPISLFEK